MNVADEVCNLKSYFQLYISYSWKWT